MFDGPVWPSGVLGTTTRLRDRILNKYDPGQWSRHYKFFDALGWRGEGWTFRWMISLPPYDKMELSWTPWK